MPERLITFLRGPLGPRRFAHPGQVTPLVSDAHGNVWSGGTAISGPAATSYTAGAQGSTGGHPELTVSPGTFQHLPALGGPYLGR